MKKFVISPFSILVLALASSFMLVTCTSEEKNCPCMNVNDIVCGWQINMQMRSNCSDHFIYEPCSEDSVDAKLITECPNECFDTKDGDKWTKQCGICLKWETMECVEQGELSTKPLKFPEGHKKRVAENAVLNYGSREDEYRTPKAKDGTLKDEKETPEDESRTLKDELRNMKKELQKLKLELRKTKIELQKCEEAPKVEATTPKDEDSTPKDEDSTPKDEDSTPKDEDSTPKDEDSTAEDENSTPKDEDPTPKDQDGTPEDEDATMKDEERLNLEAKLLSCDRKKSAVALELVLILDVSSSYVRGYGGGPSFIDSVKATMKDIYESFSAEFPAAKFGVTYFSDYNYLMYASEDDSCYELVQALTTKQEELIESVSNIPTGGNGVDTEESSLTAILYSAVDDRIGWSVSEYNNDRKVMKVLVVATDADWRTPDTKKSKTEPEPKGDGTDTCETGVPTVKLVRQVLNKKDFYMVGLIEKDELLTWKRNMKFLQMEKRSILKALSPRAPEKLASTLVLALNELLCLNYTTSETTTTEQPIKLY